MAGAHLHPRAFKVTVAWTLLLLFLGSVVHATESSLACPDWPTCFGTMLPEMSGGVFWEHLHRLVAGGLILMFGLATWLVRREAPERTGVFRACLVGLVLLVVQAVFGGLTVILRLPDAVSTTHLALALLFLVLATALAEVTGGRSSEPKPPRSGRVWGMVATALVFGQSLLGGVVRHTDAGMACPDVPLCMGEWVPPLGHPLVRLQYGHRVLGVAVALAILWGAASVWRLDPRLRRWALAAVVLVTAQIGLGVASVATILAPIPVSLHTLFAAVLLVATTVWATAGLHASHDEPGVPSRTSPERV